MRLNDRPDDGSAEWAAEAAAGLIGIVMIRADKAEGPKAAAERLAELSGFCLGLIAENPRLRKARYSSMLENT